MVAVFGREPELAVVDAFLDGGTERLRALVLEGEPGIGKTTVWRTAVRRAEERGFRVLSCRPAEIETKLALSAVTDLLEKVPEAALQALPAPQRRALDVARLRVDPGDGPAQPRTLPTAVHGVLMQLSGRGPLLVAIDDAQWLDRASSAVLGFALRRLGDTRVWWLIAQRPVERSPLDVDRLVAPEALTRAAIGPLSLTALHQVLEERLGQPLTRSALMRVHGACAGNPFYALEIGREVLRGDQVPAGVPVPDNLRKLLLARLRRLAPATREALLSASALSEPTTSVVDFAALAPAEEAELVRVDEAGRIHFHHPLFASAVYDAAPVSRRRQLHRRLSGLVTDGEERARHLAIAITEADEDVARLLEEGAALARARGAWESAAGLLERARALTPSDRPDDASRRGIVAAENHVHAGDRPRARRLLEELLARPLEESRRAYALHLLAEVAWDDENATEAMRLFRAARDCVEDTRLAVTIELGLSYVHAGLWDYPNGLAHAYRALELAEVVGDGPLMGEAVGHCVMFDFLSGNGVAWDELERSCALEDPDRVVRLPSQPSAIAALLLLYVGRHSEARQRLRAVCVAARERGDESDVAFIVLWQSWLETRCGDLAAATRLAEEAAWLATLTGSRSTLAWVLAQRAYVHAHRGDTEETRRLCLEAAPLVERSGAVLPNLWIAASLSLLELSLGNAEAAWQACRVLTEALEAQGIGEPVPAFFLPDALEALIALDQLDRAEALLGAFESRAEGLDRVWGLATSARCRALLRVARGDMAGAEEAFGRSVAAHERLEMPFERARTLLARGLTERRGQQRARARASLLEAAEIFEDTGARQWAERAHRELERVGLRRSAGADLTPTERRVAELAASGMKNREVAAALFISPKTVEANLVRIYRKLGIATRAELGARMVSDTSG